MDAHGRRAWVGDLLAPVDAATAEARILVADDEDDNALLLDMVLRRAGYESVQTVGGGQACLDVIAQGSVDLVLLDLRMPIVDGFAVLERLRADPATQVLPVVVLTSDTRGDARERALRAGATDFLTKPFDHVEVLLRIRNLLALKRAHDGVVRRNVVLTENVERTTRALERVREWLDEVDDAVVIHEPHTHDVLYANDRAWTFIRASGPGEPLDRVVELDQTSSVHRRRLDRAVFPIPLRTGGDEPVVHDVLVQRVLEGTAGEALVVAARDATPRVETEARLRAVVEREHAAALAAQQLTAVKHRFLTSISHELRTPVTVMNGTAELLHAHARRLTDEQRTELVSTLCRRVRGFSQLLLDLLSISTDDLEQTGRSLRPVRADEVVGAVVAEHPDEVTADLEPCRLLADPEMLERAVRELLDNARRYSCPGTPVRVRLGVDAEHVTLIVADDGAGFPPDVRDRAFEPFAQGSNVLHDQPGPGIGLTIVRRFATLHGGTVDLGDSPGGGALVRVRLPIGPNDA